MFSLVAKEIMVHQDRALLGRFRLSHQVCYRFARRRSPYQHDLFDTLGLETEGTEKGLMKT